MYSSHNASGFDSFCRATVRIFRVYKKKKLSKVLARIFKFGICGSHSLVTESEFALVIFIKLLFDKCLAREDVLNFNLSIKGLVVEELLVSSHLKGTE